MENVIKYGESLPDGTRPLIAVRLAPGFLTISSKNGISSDAHVDRIFDIIQRMREHSDIQAVYIEAIVQGMLTPRQNASLGLLRIAAEAGFEVNAAHGGGVLEITARKGIP